MKKTIIIEGAGERAEANIETKSISIYCEDGERLVTLSLETCLAVSALASEMALNAAQERSELNASIIRMLSE